MSILFAALPSWRKTHHQRLNSHRVVYFSGDCALFVNWLIEPIFSLHESVCSCGDPKWKCKPQNSICFYYFHRLHFRSSWGGKRRNVKLFLFNWIIFYMPTLQMHSSILIQWNGVVFFILFIRKIGCKQKRFVSKETQIDAVQRKKCT